SANDVTNLQNNAVSHPLRRGGNAVAASPDRPLPAGSGDLQTVPAAASRVIPPEHALHAEGSAERQAMETVAIHRTAEAPDVVSSPSAAKNSMGETTVVGTISVATSIHSPGETGHTQGAPPTAVSGPAHSEAAATFE